MFVKTKVKEKFFMEGRDIVEFLCTGAQSFMHTFSYWWIKTMGT